MPATVEVASDLGVGLSSISTANAGVFVSMALSGLMWLPVSTIIGRRTAYLVANVVLIACSVGCSLSPTLSCFATFWIIGGNTGPFFLVAGQTILADIFEPVSSAVFYLVSVLTLTRLFVVRLLVSFLGAASVPMQSVSQHAFVFVTVTDILSTSYRKYHRDLYKLACYLRCRSRNGNVWIDTCFSLHPSSERD